MMVVLAQRLQWLYMAAKLEFDIAVYPDLIELPIPTCCLSRDRR